MWTYKRPSHHEELTKSYIENRGKLALSRALSIGRVVGFVGSGATVGYPFAQAKIGFEHMPRIRTAIRGKEKLEIAYRSLGDQSSTRVVWPLQNAYWGRVWTMTCWCET